MKKILLAAASVALFVQANAQTITKDDLKWNIGNKWNTVAYNVDTNTITRSGTGVNWDFSAMSGGSADSLQCEASSSGNDVSFTSSNISNVEYKSLSGNWSLAKIETFAADDGTTMHIGLPHTYGGAWTSSATAAGGFITLNMSGSVPASGTVTTPYGTFSCLLVREKITGTINQTNLYWETVEHGRVAVFEGGKLSVMQSTNFTTSTTEAEASSFELFPNPASDVVNVNVKENASLVVFDALGNAVKSAAVNAGLNTVSVADLSAGIYLVQLTSNGGVETSSLVIK